MPTIFTRGAGIPYGIPPRYESVACFDPVR
jgi:hypothetical protein